MVNMKHLSPANIRYCFGICKRFVRKLRGLILQTARFHFPYCAVSFPVLHGFIFHTARFHFPNCAVSFPKPRGFISKTARFHLQNCAVSSPKPRGFVFDTAETFSGQRGRGAGAVRDSGFRPSGRRAAVRRSCPAGDGGHGGQSAPAVRARTGGGGGADGGR